VVSRAAGGSWLDGQSRVRKYHECAIRDRSARAFFQAVVNDIVETASGQFLPVETAPSSARALLRSALRRWELNGLGEVAELLTGELVTNVARHVGSLVTVRAVRRRSRIRVEVDDDCPTPPVLKHPAPLAPSGRGIVLVDSLADRWGTEVRDGGKTVWFELDVGAATQTLGASGSSAPEVQLAYLQALTDAALATLDVDDLLAELLNRVREILDADTAAVLLLDEGAGELVATAARGIEEEVREGVRVPLGFGFAGRVASTRGPIRLDRVDATTVSNPILWEKGIQVMLGVPLLSTGQLVGVLHVGRLENRPFNDRDVELLQVVADRVAGATQSRTLAIERAATGLLERSLLPERLPVCQGLELAARYVPAEGKAIGGDWYDLFTLPSGQLWIVVGDVAGHGIQASIVMGRVRSALRAYSLLELPPDEVLRLVDRKVDHFEIGMIATVACAVTDPPYDTMTVASAGHPPPVIAAPGMRPLLAGVDPDPPLGSGSGHRQSSATIPLAPGAVVAFYTDGLVERRGEPIDVGLDRLCAAISLAHPNDVTRDVMHQLIGSTTPDDDIALVVLRKTQPTPT
jgi:phosphoserine phosphatase RsbU/P